MSFDEEGSKQTLVIVPNSDGEMAHRENVFRQANENDGQLVQFL